MCGGAGSGVATTKNCVDIYQLTLLIVEYKPTFYLNKNNFLSET